MCGETAVWSIAKYQHALNIRKLLSKMMKTTNLKILLTSGNSKHICEGYNRSLKNTRDLKLHMRSCKKRIEVNRDININEKEQCKENSTLT